MSRAIVPLVFIVLLCVASTARGEIVRLKSGILVHGEIEEFDEASGITLLRADTGGVMSLRWEHLPPEEVRRIKAGFGFTGEDPEAFLVDVWHLVLRNGTTETGVLVDGPADSYTLRRRTSVDSFPRSYVKEGLPGKVEGLSVYLPEDLYPLVVDRLGGAPEDAAGHFNMAVACEGARLYDHAREHYETVRALDPTLKTELITARLQRIAIKLEDAAETARIDEIKNQLFRRQFGAAMALAADFRKQYPSSRQIHELTSLEGQIRERKLESHAQQIVSDYFTRLDRRLDSVARTDGVTLDMAQELVENEIHGAILEDLAEEYEVTEDTVQQLWTNRRGGSPRSAFYGSGTFILGKERALLFGRFTEDGEAADDEPEDEAAAGNEAHEDIVERIKRQRALQAAERQRSSRGSALTDAGPTPEEWWTSAPRDERVKWLSAYYAEASSQVSVLEARGRNCRQCDATGFIEVLNADQELERQTCPTCKGLRYERFIKFR